MDNEELGAMNVLAYKQHQAAQAIARQFGFDPSDESFAKCVGAILEAWRVDSSLGDRSGAARRAAKRICNIVPEGKAGEDYFTSIIEQELSRTVTPGSGEPFTICGCKVEVRHIVPEGEIWASLSQSQILRKLAGDSRAEKP